MSPSTTNAPGPTGRRAGTRPWGRWAGTRPWGRHATAAAAGIGLLAVSWLLLADRNDTVPEWEIHVFDAVNGLPDVLRWPLWPIMQLGAFAMYVIGGAATYALTRRARPALAAALGVLLAWGLSRLVKETIERGRPAVLLDDVTVRDSADGYGYVSGHSAVAFGLATVLTALLPGRWRWVPYPVAAGVGFARIFFGAHLPLDVVGGAGAGLLGGVAALVVFGADVEPDPPQPDPPGPGPDRDPEDVAASAGAYERPSG